jgi:hypothetical protein
VDQDEWPFKDVQIRHIVILGKHLFYIAFYILTFVLEI